MTPWTLVKFLVGSRGAIMELAQSRWTLLVGLLLVLSGTLARAYDTAYLVGEWPVLLHGVVVSIGNSLVLYSMVYAAARKGENVPRFWGGYLSFLGLFWMTAPMAWLYGIPYERFMTPLGAVHANLWTLAAVSVWRVVLITRVLSVVFGASSVRVFFLVMLFADVALFLAALLAPKPVVDFMGGLQQTEVEQAVVGSAFVVLYLTALSFPVWLVGAIIGVVWFKAEWAVGFGERKGVPRWMVGFAVLAVVAWVPGLVIAQPEQRLRYRAEEMLRGGRVHEALGEMSAHERGDYPPVWDPPPRHAYGDREPPMAAIRKELAKAPPAPWVEKLFVEKSWRAVPQFWQGEFTADGILEMTEPLYAWQQLDLDGLEFHVEHDPRLTERQRVALGKFVKEAKEAEARDKRPPP